MSEHFLRILEREHARLEAAIAAEQRRPRPDMSEITRLKKAKLIVKDQLTRWQEDVVGSAAA